MGEGRLCFYPVWLRGRPGTQNTCLGAAEPNSEGHRQSLKGCVRDGLSITLVCGDKSQCGAHWPDSFAGSHEAGKAEMGGEDALPQGFPNSANHG